jgi:hypothetical protein
LSGWRAAALAVPLLVASLAPPAHARDERGAQPHRGATTIEVVSSTPGLSLQQRLGATLVGPTGAAMQSGYAHLCTAPCRLRLPAGPRQFGVADVDGTTTATPELKIPPGGARLELSYESHEATRMRGVAALTLGIVTGTAATWAIAASDGYEDCSSGDCELRSSRWVPALAVGGTLLLAGTVFGVLWMLESDVATIRVLPGAPSSPHVDLRRDAGSALSSLAGLTVHARF